MPEHLPTTAAILAAYPLPWTAVLDLACARIVAANGATVLACAPDEGPIATYIASALRAYETGTAPSQTHRIHNQHVAALVDVLAGLDAYPTEGDFVDALILAAEAVIAAAQPTPTA